MQSAHGLNEITMHVSRIWGKSRSLWGNNGNNRTTERIFVSNLSRWGANVILKHVWVAILVIFKLLPNTSINEIFLTECNTVHIENCKTRINEEAILHGFPASPLVVRHYTLRKAGSWQKQRSWNSHEAVWWWWWWQRGSREKLSLPYSLRYKAGWPSLCLSPKMFSLSFSLLLHDVSL